ncbi:MAG: PhnD/SsuA/transferrin family substrate-binding protein [Deltaproteobacteria bacterium]|nr:PhnD/SsuA/transferrin family substrate-binding protein [Deltaproteobacteria bacterium]
MQSKVEPVGGAIATRVASPPERWVGRELGGRFVVLRPLGRGGMACVYEAESRATGKRVALKILEPDARLSHEQARRFLREARAAARIRHPNVVTVFDIDEDEITTALFIVEELLEGRDLRALLRAQKDGKLSIDMATGLLFPIAEALEAAHQLGVVHCDVTPANIFVSRRHESVIPKLIDFGISQRLDRVARRRDSVIGTPPFMAPEHARGEPIDARADIWSFGAVLYRCITGALPYDVTSARELVRAVEEESMVPVDERIDVPAELAAVIHRALDPVRDRRFASMADLLYAVRGAQPSAYWRSAALATPIGDECKAAGTAERLPWRPAARPMTAPPQPIPTRRLARVGRLRFGAVVGDRTKSELRALDALAHAVSSKIVLVPFDGYPRLLDALAEGRTDLAWLSPLAYVRAHRSGAARQVLCVRRDDRRSYASALVVRAADGPFDARNLEGARAAWVSPWSAAGYLVPRRMLRALGIEPEQALRAQTFRGANGGVIRALLDGEADVAATPCRVLANDTIAAGALCDDRRLKVIALSAEAIPGDTVCASNALGVDGARDVVERFVEQAFRPELQPLVQPLLGSERFVAPNPSLYEPLAAAFEADLALA